MYDAPRLSPQWLCGNSCTLAHDVRFAMMYVYEQETNVCMCFTVKNKQKTTFV